MSETRAAATSPVSNLGNPKTESELQFEAYLRAHGYKNWEHETPIEGKRKTPDYRLEFAGASHFIEVKEFAPYQPPMGYGAFDTVGPIREKINQATRKFKEYKEFPCSVLLANPHEAFVALDRHAIMGGMLGNIGFTVQIGTPIGPDNPAGPVFTTGGKMINDERQEPQNSTINAVIVLATYPLRINRIRINIRAEQMRLDRELSLDEALTFWEALPDSDDLRPVRVIIYENPYARLQLNRTLFRGPYDQRFGAEDGFIKRVYAGEGIREIESLLEDPIGHS